MYKDLIILTIAVKCNYLIYKVKLILVLTSLTQYTRKKYKFTKPSARGPLMAQRLHILGNSSLGKVGMSCSVTRT